MSSLIRFDKSLFLRGNSRTAKDFVFGKPVSLNLSAAERWAIIGPTKTDFLKAINGGFLVAEPKTKRVNWTELGSPSGAFEYLHFRDHNNAGSGFTHMSARYEFFKDVEVDERLENYISRIPYPRTDPIDFPKLNFLLEKLQLEHLKGKFVNALSNGQFRRAKIARSAYVDPKVWLVDDIFLGLDPSAAKTVSNFLLDFTSRKPESLVVLGLRIQDKIPDWVTNVALVDRSGLVKAGKRTDLESDVQSLLEEHHRKQDSIREESAQFQKRHETMAIEPARTIIKFSGVSVQYRDRPVLKDLHWEVNSGEKWHIRGKNGSGKTTMLSLITLDHPQSWNDSIEFLGKPRATGSTNFFKTNEHISMTSPELHSIFPQSMSLYNTVSSGFAAGVIRAPRELSSQQNAEIKAYLEHFGLWESREQPFRNFSVSDQKLALFLRAIIKKPDVLILDEALSAMDDDNIAKCKAIIESWNHGCVLSIGHIIDEVPPSNKYIELVNAPEGEYVIGDC